MTFETLREIARDCLEAGETNVAAYDDATYRRLTNPAERAFLTACINWLRDENATKADLPDEALMKGWFQSESVRRYAQWHLWMLPRIKEGPAGDACDEGKFPKELAQQLKCDQNDDPLHHPTLGQLKELYYEMSKLKSQAKGTTTDGRLCFGPMRPIKYCSTAPLLLVRSGGGVPASLTVEAVETEGEGGSIWAVPALGLMNMDEDWRQTPESVKDFYRNLLPHNYEYRYRITFPGDEIWPHSLNGNSWFGQLQMLILCLLYKISRDRRRIRRQFDLPVVLPALSLPYAVEIRPPSLPDRNGIMTLLKKFTSWIIGCLPRLPRLSTSRVAISASSAKPQANCEGAASSAWSPVGDILKKLSAAVEIAVPRTKIIVVAKGQAFDSLAYRQPDSRRGIWDDPENEFKLIKAGSLKEFLALFFHIHRWRRRLMILAPPLLIATCLCTVIIGWCLLRGSPDLQMARLITAIQNEESADGHQPGRDSIARGFEKWRSTSVWSSNTALSRVHDFLATASTEPNKRMRALFLSDKMRLLNSSFLPPTNALAISVGSNSMMLLRLEPGSFTMGASAHDPDAKLDEQMQATKVTVTRAFWIGKYEVTQNEFRAVMLNNPSFFNGERYRSNEWDKFDYGDGSLRPVETVTWHDAMAFCDLLSRTNRMKIDEVAGSTYVVRLPTEAEWEYACRAGTTNDFGLDDTNPSSKSVIEEHAWISKDRVMAVGLKLPNYWGLYDMQGNVNEFCVDTFQWVQNFRPSTNDPVSVFPSDFRAVRGGAYSDGGAPRRLKCAYRFPSKAIDPGNAFGFRIVIGPKIELLNQRKEVGK